MNYQKVNCNRNSTQTIEWAIDAIENGLCSKFYSKNSNL